MSVTLVEVMAAAEARLAPVVGEIAGYIVLGVADELVSAPRSIRVDDVEVTEDGSVRILRGAACADRASETGLRSVLRALLEIATSSTPALRRAGRRAPGAGVEALVREIEAALIPVNRAAGRRAVARLARETARALLDARLDLDSARELGASFAPPPADAQAPPLASLAGESEIAALEAVGARAPEVEPIAVTMGVAPPLPAAVEVVSVPPPMVHTELLAPVELVEPVPPPPDPTFEPADVELEVEELPAEFDVDVELEIELAVISPPPLRSVAGGPCDAVTRPEGPRNRPPLEVVPRTPVLGSIVSREQVSIATEAPLIMAGADATDPMPPVAELPPTPSPPAVEPVPAPPVAELPPTPPADEPVPDEPVPDVSVQPVAVDEPALADTPFAGEVALVAPIADDDALTPLGPKAFLRPPPARAAFSSRPPQSISERKSDVHDLVRRFAVAEVGAEGDLGRELKKLAGLEPTPPPPGVLTGTD